MGQKVHPLSLRIPSSFKTYTDLWYSKKHYTHLFLKKLLIEKYISNVLKQKGLPEGQISLSASSKSHRYLVSFLNPKESRKLKYTRYRLQQISTRKTRNLAQTFLPTLQEKTEIQNRTLKAETGKVMKMPQLEILEKKTLSPSVVLKSVCLSAIENPEMKEFLPYYLKSIQKTDLKVGKTQKFMKDSVLRRPPQILGNSSTLSQVLESYGKIPSTISLWANAWESQHADFLAQEIALALVQRVPFRTIKYQLLKEIEENSKNQWGAVRGIRITCSGRGGSRSKKAQRAQTLRFQWGQTSLHTFSEKIGFASRSALTSFGQTGIKVWICYK